MAMLIFFRRYLEFGEFLPVNWSYGTGHSGFHLYESVSVHIDY